MNKRVKQEQAYNDLAVERTILSNERTTLSYIRTGLTAFALGIALVKIFETSKTGVTIGIISSLIGISFILIGMIYHTKEKKMIEQEKKAIQEMTKKR